MKLELVNFKQAKALMKLGYPQLSADYSYSTSGDELVRAVDTEDYMISAPSLELVAKWLRKEKNIHIELKLPNPAYCPWWHCDLRDIKTREIIAQTISYEKDEEALSAGIDKAIKILTMED